MCERGIISESVAGLVLETWAYSCLASRASCIWFWFGVSCASVRAVVVVVWLCLCRLSKGKT